MSIGYCIWLFTEPDVSSLAENHDSDPHKLIGQDFDNF